MKREAIGHTKLKKLCRRMDIPLWQAVGLLELLWHVTARECPRGDIGKLTDEDIALALDYRGDEHALIEALLATGWLDSDPAERLVIHHWVDHSDDSVHMKLSRSRQFFVGGRPPKYSRLPSEERESAKKFYAETQFVRTNDSSVRTACAQKADPCAGLSLSLSLSPALAPPSHVSETSSPLAVSAKKHSRKPPRGESADELIENLQKEPAFEKLNVRSEFNRCAVWCATNRKAPPSRRRLVNWLLKSAIDAPLNGAGSGKSARKREEDEAFQKALERNGGLFAKGA